jgi:hypothetical protein
MAPSTGGANSRVAAMPTAYTAKLAASEARASAVGDRRASTPPRCRTSTDAIGDPGPGIASRRGRRSRLPEVGEQASVTDPGHGLLGIRVQRAEFGHRAHRERIDLRIKRPQRAEQPDDVGLGLDAGRLDDHERPALELPGDSGARSGGQNSAPP